jgi:hypothetical protein
MKASILKLAIIYEVLLYQMCNALSQRLVMNISKLMRKRKALIA